MQKGRAEFNRIVSVRHQNMQKLVLLSVILATFAIPGVLLNKPKAHEYATVLKYFGAFVGIYVVLVLVVYPRLF
ncbi:MAG: hypothetical protein WCP29_01130 [Acidobacteriota bacterium]